MDADGLTTSGLAASSIAGVPEAQLTVDGLRRYFVLLPDGTRMNEGTEGTWRMEYRGQPLRVLTLRRNCITRRPTNRLDIRSTSTVSSWQARTGPIVLTLDVDHEAADRRYANDYVSIIDVC